MSSEKTNLTNGTTNQGTEDQTLIEFPCEFPVKVMGSATPEFVEQVNQIATTHDEKFDSKQTTQNTSKTGKYISLTLNIHAKNQSQLDSIYKDLTDNELVLWAL